MNQNSNQSSASTNEINIVEIVFKIWKSKIIVFLITIVITIGFLFHEIQKDQIYSSKIMIEIGSTQSNFDSSNKTKNELIENPGDLLSQFQIDFNIKKLFNTPTKVSVSFSDKSIITLNTSSSSSEDNKKSLNIVSKYILDRHSNLFNDIHENNKEVLTNKLSSLDKQMKFKTELFNSKIAEEILNIDFQILNIDRQLESLKNVLSSTKADNLVLQSTPELILKGALKTPTLKQEIYNYEARILELKARKFGYQRRLLNLKNPIISDEIFQLKLEKEQINNQLKELEIKQIYPTRLIGEIENALVNDSILQRIFFGFFVGLFISIGFVLLKEYIDSLRKSSD